MRLVCLSALLLFPLTASGQVLQTDFGGGTLLTGGTAGGGAGATLYIPNQNIYTSADYYQGHWIFGASDEFNFHNYDITAGTKMLGFSSGGVGVGLSIFGLTVRRKRELTCSDAPLPALSRLPGYSGWHCAGGWDFTAFVGATGPGYLMPYAFGSKQQHIGAGVLVQRKFRNGLYWSSLDLLNGGTYSLAEGVGYRYRQKFDLSLSGGIITNSRYFNGVLFYQPVHVLSFNASHASYFNPYAARGNGLSTSLAARWFNAQASVNDSQSFGVKVFGKSVGGGVRAGWLGAQSSWYRAAGRTLLNHSAIETFRHWSATEGITQSATGTSFTGSVSYHTNRANISINRGIQFLLNGRGYQSVTSGLISFRLGSLVVNAQAVADPFGRVLWSGWSESYTQTGLHAPEGRGFTTHGSGGKYLISGRCLEEDKPLEGCAIQIGTQIAFSNSRGEFELRQRKSKPANTTVDLKEFTAPGTFEIVSSPLTATPGQKITIVVRRVQ